MARMTFIEWCDHTFNPWIGCFKISPGCENCYAEVDTPARVSRASGVELWGQKASRRIKAESAWKEPLKWDRDASKAGERRRVFCASQADVFEDHPDVVGSRLRLFDLIYETQNLDWLLLTKRPQQALTILREQLFLKIERGLYSAAELMGCEVLRNVWMGVSVEDYLRSEDRIPSLLEIPASVRFLSIEPLLGPFLLSAWLDDLDWVIVGGESGPRARPCEVQWIESIVDQCQQSNVPCFVKQLGSNTPSLRLRDSKGGDPAEWPEDLRVREFPPPWAAAAT